MKKSFILAAIALIAAISITIVSCKKDNVTEKKQSVTTSKLSETAQQEIESSDNPS